MFQFLIGIINRGEYVPEGRQVCTFQFLIGIINPNDEELKKNTQELFQFLIGIINHFLFSPDSTIFSCFNSS